MIALSRKLGKLDTGLIGRGLEGFKKCAAVELQPSGVTELDVVLGGGFPRGSLVELCGPASSGRTITFNMNLAQLSAVSMIQDKQGEWVGTEQNKSAKRRNCN